MTSQPIRLSTNFMTLIPSLTFTDYEWFPWSICNGCGMPAGNAYPSGHLVPSPILGLANAPIVETKFLELAMSLLDFSPRIPLGTFLANILFSVIKNWTIFIVYPAEVYRKHGRQKHSKKFDAFHCILACRNFPEYMLLSLRKYEIGVLLWLHLYLDDLLQKYFQ